MNRILAILLAMVILLSHCLAIHLDGVGELGAPYDYAHRAFHLARNFVYEGVLAWNTGLEGGARGGLESYPSPLWVVVAGIGERLYVPVTRFTQIVGIAAALMTVRVSVLFDKERISSVIPALLLVTNGAFAAAAPSGLEFSMVAFLLTLTFVAFERRRGGFFGLALGLLVLARPEGVVAIVLFGLFALQERFSSRRGKDQAMGLLPFLPALLAAGILFMAPTSTGGSLYGSWLQSLIQADQARLDQGLGYLADMLVTAVTPILIVYPIGALLFRRLTRTGHRALICSLVWIGLVILEGGGPQPFSVAFVPALPLLTIAIQQGVFAALDTHIRAMERLAWTALMGTSLLGVLASKPPGSLKGLGANNPLAEWMGPARGPAPYGGGPALGRAAIEDEMRRTGKLRDVAHFLREHVDGPYTILSPHVGALGYLSHLSVLDMFGQITTPPGAERTPLWSPRPAIDLLAALNQRPDFILPHLKDLTPMMPGAFGLGFDELLELDGSSEDADRQALIAKALADYELVAVPIQTARELRRGRGRPFPLLRRKDLGLTPRLQLVEVEGEVRVTLESDWPRGSQTWPGHPQLVRLAVEATDEKGRVWYLDPQGRPDPKLSTFVRTDLRLLPAPGHTVRLATFPLQLTPGGTRLVSLRGRLFNPVLAKSLPLAPVSPEAALDL